jgi:hypothetical protein
MSKVTQYFLCLILLSVSATSQAVSLQNGDILMFTTGAGSSVSGVGAGGQVFDSAGLDALNGIVIGSTQPTIPDIDNLWTSNVVGVQGNHRTTLSVDVLSASTLDFSGWIMSSGGQDYAFGAGQSIATYTNDGTNFTLDYSWDAASHNGGNPLGPLGVTAYNLHLAGTVSSVPVPAAAWLFGSGLLGLIGVARRKKA